MALISSATTLFLAPTSGKLNFGQTASYSLLCAHFLLQILSINLAKSSQQYP
jgi:hypothetical protein